MRHFQCSKIYSPTELNKPKTPKATLVLSYLKTKIGQEIMVGSGHILQVRSPRRAIKNARYLFELAPTL